MKKNYERIWMISDIHFGNHAGSLQWLESTVKYFENFFIPMLRKNVKSNDVLFVLGDVFDNRLHINSVVMNKVVWIFDIISKILPVEIIVGNHDIAYKSTNDVHSLIVLNYMNNVTVHTEPKLYSIYEKKMLIIPWRKDDNSFLDEVTLNQPDYIFCHHDFLGLNYNANIKVEAGIKKSKLKGVKKVFSGHIHWRQENSKIIMIGNPLHQSRNDINNQKGIYLFDCLAEKIQFFENNYSSLYKKIDLNDYLCRSVSDFVDCISNNIVDIIINTKYKNSYSWHDFNELTSKAKDVKFIMVDDELTSSYSLDNQVNRFKINEEINKYVTALDQPTDVKKLMKSKIKELYDSAMSKGK